MKDYLIVVDANYPAAALRLMEDLKKISSKRVKYVINTHHHGDHIYANALWTKQGAITVAHQNVSDEMKKYEPGRFEGDVRSRKDVRALNIAIPEPPKQTFTGELFTFKDSTRTVELRHYGFGHTRGDVFVYLPKEQILITGDAVCNGSFNYMPDSDLVNWPKILRTVGKLKIKSLLPGHGPAGGVEILEGQALFLELFRKAVKSQVDQGKKLEEITRESLQLPESVQHWVGSMWKAQIRDAYEEITLGKPHGDIPHK